MCNTLMQHNFFSNLQQPSSSRISSSFRWKYCMYLCPNQASRIALCAIEIGRMQREALKKIKPNASRSIHLLHCKRPMHSAPITTLITESQDPRKPWLAKRIDKAQWPSLPSLSPGRWVRKLPPGAHKKMHGSCTISAHMSSYVSLSCVLGPPTQQISLPHSPHNSNSTLPHYHSKVFMPVCYYATDLCSKIIGRRW